MIEISIEIRKQQKGDIPELERIIENFDDVEVERKSLGGEKFKVKVLDNQHYYSTAPCLSLYITKDYLLEFVRGKTFHRKDCGDKFDKIVFNIPLKKGESVHWDPSERNCYVALKNNKVVGFMSFYDGVVLCERCVMMDVLFVNHKLPQTNDIKNELLYFYYNKTGLYNNIIEELREIIKTSKKRGDLDEYENNG